MRISAARFDFRELLSWYRGWVKPVAFRMAGVTMTDIDDRGNRILVGVERPDQILPIKEVLSQLPLPEGAVAVIQFDGSNVEVKRSRSYEHSFTSSSRRSTSLRGSIRPVLGGSKITVYDSEGSSTCSLGFNLITRISGSVQPVRYFITNSHCAHPRGDVESNGASQPSGSSSSFGVEWVDPGWLDHTDTEDCDTGDICRFSDAAMFKHNYPSTADMGRVALPDEDEWTYDDVVDVYEVLSPVVGWSAHMIGQASGHTIGEIQNSCTDLRVYDNGVPTNMVMLCQAVASYESTDGDSGAPIIEPVGTGSLAFALGIHWGSGGRFSPMYAVLNELYENMTSNGIPDPIRPSTSPTFYVSMVGPSVVGPNDYACSSWSASVSGGQTPYQYLWSGLFESDEASVSGTVPQTGGHIEVYVMDSNGNHGIAYVDVVYSSSHLDYCQ